MNNNQFVNNLMIEIETLPIVSFSTQQNGIKIIRSLCVINPNRDAVTDLDIEITSTPGFALPFSCHLDKISPNSRYEVKEAVLILDGTYLIGITERLAGYLQIVLKRNDEVICDVKKEITVLAYDEWSGSANCPELISSFVTPNNPSIIPISARAASLMEYWTHDPSLTGYQKNDPNHVQKMAAAVFSALKEKNIVYSMPPASFETNGQRVRMVEEVLNTKLGTCLDFSVLYASCLEAIGLHPVIVFFNGHACCGVWLVEKTLSECVSDDVAVLTKRIADGVNEIALAECTYLAAGGNETFEDAKSVAEKKLFEEDSFRYVVDVHRCRLATIKPIPSKSQMENGVNVSRPDVNVETQAPSELNSVINIDPSAITAATRKSRWEHKLLDLGLRNTLINLRFTRTLVPVLCSDINEVEDGLASGREYSLLGRPEEWTMKDGENIANHILDSAQKNVISSELHGGRLRSLYSDTEIKASLKELFRSAKLSIEENGANTLYLALGMLRWYENARSMDKPRFAPIILLPVELSRKGSGEGYSLKLRDEDPQINVTMLEKIKQDFNLVIEGIDPLPQDDAGVDTRKVFTIIRRAIMAQKGWDVIETACLGIFSFTQFVMWNDLHQRSDDLEKNKIVKSLIEGCLTWDAEPMDVSRTVSEDQALLPLPTDASQLYAIKAAADGNSFVLQGPPGTGKSQAITAMIANALAMGKTVLFVAEKMAALEVVEKRLQKIGIGDFCLELHSNKAKKKNVLEQLRKSLEKAKINSLEYEEKANKIAETRHQLDCYVNELHADRSCGMTLFTLINEYEDNYKAADIEKLDESLFMNFNKVPVEELFVQAERLTTAGKMIGSPNNHPLSRIGSTEYRQSMRSELGLYVDAYIKALNELKTVVDEAGNKLNLQNASIDKLQSIYKLFSIVDAWKGIPSKWAIQEDFCLFIDQINKLATAKLDLYVKKDRWKNTWTEESNSLPAEILLNEYRNAASSWFIPKLMGLNKLKKKLVPFMYVKPSTEELEMELNVLDRYQRAQKTADELTDLHAGKLDSEYHGEATDWKNILELTARARNNAKAFVDFAGSDGIRPVLFSIPDIYELSDKYLASWKQMIDAKSSLYQLLDIREETGVKDWINSEIHDCKELINHQDELKEFIAWNEISKECRNMGMSALVDAYINGLNSNMVVPAFKKRLYKQLIEKTIDSSNVLSKFSGVQFNERIQQFKNMDNKLTQLTQKEIYYRLASNLPNITREAAQSSELGVLQRAIRSGGRGLTIRKLVEQIPTMLPRLCPCMLMSPISAAQYLDPHREPFDLVIFDEASQISTAKAVGVLARGKDAVIVGDPKQMPPTSFFATNTVDEDDFINEDLESILEDCLAINMPQTSLLWHYRSRHESLISFSNSEFYNNELYTFPSVNDRDAKVTFVRVNGTFDRGKTRQNRAEAEAVLKELVSRAHDEDKKNQSVGVVTFNIVQQNLIDDLLSEAASNDPVLYTWAYESEEPVFIKNLENVQGDERDVILFSIGYGPDKSGKLSMNFGPLNRDGGWRRLNVAVTRARAEMKVFSSMDPDAINLSRTSAVGVKALKEFMQYAKDHMATENREVMCDVPETKGIIDSICEALAEKGYKTDVLVGHSEYRIDIGVIDRNDSDKYILGIILDGKNYKDAKTTRDREIAQITVLNGLGWHIHRVWSVDWWDNKNKELNRIFAEIERIETSGDEIEPEANEVQSEEENQQEDSFNRYNGIVLEESMSQQEELTLPKYTADTVHRLSLTPDEFGDTRYRNMIMKCADGIIFSEAPISHEYLLKRIVHNAGLSRMGSRMRAAIESSISTLAPAATTAGGVFYWNDIRDAEKYAQIRKNGDGDANRSIEDIHFYEIENAMLYVLSEQGTMGNDDLVRQIAKVFGFQRVAENISKRINNAIEFSVKTGKTAIKNDRYVLTEKGAQKALVVTDWIKSKGIKRASDFVQNVASPKPKKEATSISWFDFEDHDDWSDSTKLSKFARLEPLCSSSDLVDYLDTFNDDANAMKFVEKAIARGMRFSVFDSLGILSHSDGKIEDFVGAINFDKSSVDYFFELLDCTDEDCYTTLIEAAAKSGIKIDAKVFIDNGGYYSEDIQKLFIEKLLIFDNIDAATLFDSVGDIFDGEAAEKIAQIVIDKGMRLTWQLVEDKLDNFDDQLTENILLSVQDYSRCDCSDLIEAMADIPDYEYVEILTHASMHGLYITKDDIDMLNDYLTEEQMEDIRKII